MSWKYTSSSYTPRNNLSTREPSSQSDLGFVNSKLGSSELERRFKWSSTLSGDANHHRNLLDTAKQNPAWTRTNVKTENPISVQRTSKERYGLDKEGLKPCQIITESIDLTGRKPSKFYGRSLTSLTIEDKSAEGNSSYSKFRRKPEKPSETERNNFPSRFDSTRSVEVPRSLNIPGDSSKLPVRKYSNESSPSEKLSENQEEFMTVVTRGTSPTPTVSTVYLRSKRNDYGIEKRIPKPRKKPEMVHRGIQTDKEPGHYYSKYSTYVESNARARPWTSYADKYSTGNSYNPKYSSRGNYGFEGKSNSRDQCNSLGGIISAECKRSTSREEAEDPTTPESPSRSHSGKPPLVKESDKRIRARKSPPSSFVLTPRTETAKTETVKTPNSPNLPSSPLHCKLTETPKPGKVTGGQSPKVTIDRCPDIIQAIADVSSASESSSSEEEENSDEEPEEKKSASGQMSIKKSITNFLQNIPSQSRMNSFHLPNGSSHKINFRSGERGRWCTEGSDQAPSDGSGTRSAPGHSPECQATKSNGFLSPPNRHFGNAKFGREEESEKFKSECSPLEDRSRSSAESNGVQSDSRHFMKFNLQSEETFNDGRRYPGDFPRECSVREINQKLQNGLRSPLEEKTFLEAGGMSGLISKAKSELAKSKPDIRKSSSRELSPLVTDPKSEIDLYWKELAESSNRPLRLCDLDFTDLNSDDETDITGASKANGEVPPPPPPPPMLVPVPNWMPAKPSTAPLAGATSGHRPTSPRNFRAPAGPPSTPPQAVKNKKTVKLFWKEVKDESMLIKPRGARGGAGGSLIWDELKTVKVDTQKLEHLFESKAKDLISKKQQDQGKNKEIIVLDPKRSNAINIGMTKLPPPRAIKTAILKMDSTVVNKEGIEKVLTMLPTEEEKLRIQEAQNLNPDIPLGSAEQFLLTLASISQLEARLRLWAFKLDFEISEKEICEPLMDLKQGMEILKVNKTFRAILGTLLSIGNFLNGYDVKGFQIEYLSKVPEVKDTIHKHSLLHHLCIMVMEKFPDSTDLYSEIGAVTRASKVDFDELAANIKQLEEDCKLSWNHLKIIAKHEGHTAMKVKMSDFLADCAERIIVLGIVHKRIMNRFQKFAYWLGVPTNGISTTRPNEIFKIVSEFALEFRTTRDRVLQQIKKINREKSKTRAGNLSADTNALVGKKMNSKELKDEARLKQLLGKETENMNVPAWRRQRRDTKNILQEANQNDAEILETLLKTANQRSGLNERRRSRILGKCCRSRSSTSSSDSLRVQTNGLEDSFLLNLISLLF